MSIFYLQQFDKINPISISKDHFPKQEKPIAKNNSNYYNSVAVVKK
jgi:hypothetical protein